MLSQVSIFLKFSEFRGESLDNSSWCWVLMYILQQLLYFGKESLHLVKAIRKSSISYAWESKQKQIRLFTLKNIILLSDHLQCCLSPEQKQGRDYLCMPLSNCFYTSSMLPKNTSVFWLNFLSLWGFWNTKREKKKKKKRTLDKSVTSHIQCVKGNAEDTMLAHNSLWTWNKRHTVAPINTQH